MPGNVIEYIKKHGGLEALRHAFQRLGFVRFSRSLLFLGLKLDNLADDVVEPYSFHIATVDDIKKTGDVDYEWFTTEETIRRLHNGHILFVLKERDRFVYYLWAEIRRAEIPWLDMDFEMPEDMLYITGISTLPEIRNKGIGSRLKREIVHFLKRQGYRRLVEVVNPSNAVALRIDKRLGFEEYQTITYRRYWHIRFYDVRKSNCAERKRYVTLFRSPKDIWRTFF